MSYVFGHRSFLFLNRPPDSLIFSICIHLSSENHSQLSRQVNKVSRLPPVRKPYHCATLFAYSNPGASVIKNDKQ